MATGRIKASLLSLPDELLSAIFSEVVHSDGSWRAVTLVSTCRRLAAIVRPEVYRDLRVGDDKAEFGHLSGLCAKRPDLRALVQVLHLRRTDEELDNGEIRIDYTVEHPCIQLLRLHFPALHTLSVFGATPADIFDVLSRISVTTGPDIRRLTLGIAPDFLLDGQGVHKEIWWHLLARLPMLADLTFYTTSFGLGLVRIVFADARALSPLPNLQSLTLAGEPWDPVGAPTLAALFPNLKRLRLDCEPSAELETLLRQAPTSLTHLTLSVEFALLEGLQSDVLARFPLLERLSLRGIDATASLPSIRTSRIKSLCLMFRAELTDKTLLDLVDGPARMGCLEALQLDYLAHYVDLDWDFRFDTLYDLAQIKAAASPRWPAGCSPEGLRAVVDAAHRNGIKVFGTAVDCLGWSDRFDEQAERYLVDNALASNDYTDRTGRPRLRSHHLAPFTSSSDPTRLCRMASMEGDTSPLFRLPEELLELVVEQALAEAVPAAILLRTCARLARITRKLHYAQLEYGGEWERYVKLVQLMNTRPDLRMLVKDVTMRPVYERDDSDGDDCAYPSRTRILAHFPSLKTLRILGPPPNQVTEILASTPGPTHPLLQHVAIELSAAEWSRFSEFSWWESLACFPDMGELSLHGNINLGRSEDDRADPGARPQVPAMLKGLHTLTIRYLPAPTDGAAAFTDELPALTNLAVEGEEAMTSRWLSIAPLSLTQITLWTTEDPELDELPRRLGRFPDLQHLRLVGNGGIENFVPFLRTDKLRHLELHYSTTCELFNDVGPLLDLICGPNRMRHLRSIHLRSDSDHCQTSDKHFRDCLRAAIEGSTDEYTVIDLKPECDPFHDHGDLATAEDVQRLVDAARSNGIKIVGNALRCLDWEQRFEDLVESYFVEHALATNDYTILRRQYGKRGATEAIRRQRPLLAAMLSGDGS